ncbi:MAG TPA: glycosyltransferase family 9 protein [Vicinamibacteria bacterium]|jgi:ADP-heptose:LPS heptosyltransferase|nr:glycosyltransferase family 9 protein [Vicinamibacteria bacterium]
MPRRRRWTAVKGTATRVSDPLERVLIAGFDLAGRLVPSRRSTTNDAPREVLVLRLDRIGDVLMSLPALADLRAALPEARIRLAVGAWSAEVAARAPVDEVLVWSAPWVRRKAEGGDSLPALARKARALRARPPDLAIDLQGDLRASVLMALTGARERVGYANTGGAWLLTRIVELDESVSWVEQNRAAVALASGRAGEGRPPPLVSETERAEARRLLAEAGALARPLIGIHASGGRPIKQWPLERWAAVGARLQEDFGASVVLTGSEADRPLSERLRRALRHAVDLAGRLSMRQTMAVIAELDLFLSPDTGPMHLACAVGTPSVSVFGPSDPARYFSGGHDPARHVAVRRELWCAPCNLIRRPPEECAEGEAPECLRLVTVEEVHAHAARLLRERGHGPRVARPA